MKQTPLKRGKPMRRTRMKRKPPRRVTRPGPGSDPMYLDWVRGLGCLACEGRPVGMRPVEAHHAGPKRMDRTAIPLCWLHHEDWHAGIGFFDVRDGWNKAARRAWASVAIKVVQGWRATAEAETGSQ